MWWPCGTRVVLTLVIASFAVAWPVEKYWNGLGLVEPPPPTWPSLENRGAIQLPGQGQTNSRSYGAAAFAQFVFKTIVLVVQGMEDDDDRDSYPVSSGGDCLVPLDKLIITQDSWCGQVNQKISEVDSTAEDVGNYVGGSMRQGCVERYTSTVTESCSLPPQGDTISITGKLILTQQCTTLQDPTTVITDHAAYDACIAQADEHEAAIAAQEAEIAARKAAEAERRAQLEARTDAYWTAHKPADGDVAEPADKMAAIVDQMFLEVCGRHASAAETSSYVAQVSAGETYATVRMEIAALPEVAQRISEVYEALLDRAPSAQELSSQHDSLGGSGSFSLQDLRAQLATGDEVRGLVYAECQSIYSDNTFLWYGHCKEEQLWAAAADLARVDLRLSLQDLYGMIRLEFLEQAWFELFSTAKLRSWQMVDLASASDVDTFVQRALNAPAASADTINAYWTSAPAVRQQLHLWLRQLMLDKYFAPGPGQSYVWGSLPGDDEMFLHVPPHMYDVTAATLWGNWIVKQVFHADFVPLLSQLELVGVHSDGRPVTLSVDAIEAGFTAMSSTGEHPAIARIRGRWLVPMLVALL